MSMLFCRPLCVAAQPMREIEINAIIDSEHMRILEAIENFKNYHSIPNKLELYNICKSHWNTELELYKLGIQEMQNRTHCSTTAGWIEHETEHKKVLAYIKDINPQMVTNDQLDKLKQNISEHITKFDIPHFQHWAEEVERSETKKLFRVKSFVF